MGFEVRTIDDEELPAWTEAVRVGFLGHATDDLVDLIRRMADLDRSYGAFDGDRVVGTLRSFPTELTVPGGVVPAAAVTNVTVTGTHRRQGLLTQMMTRDLADCAERGEVISTLIAAEYPIYGRFGYGPAAQASSYEVEAHAPFRDPLPPGSVELIEPRELRGLAPELYEAFRPTVPGAIIRREGLWDIEVGLEEWPGHPSPGPRFSVLSRDARGEPDGYLTYHVKDEWVRERPQGTLTVDDLIGVTPQAEARLWHYALNVDWIAKVEVENASTDELLPWLLVDRRLAACTLVCDLEWIRVLDPIAALAGRRYLAPGRVVLEVHDELGHARGRFVLEGGPDGAECRPTTESAELTLGVSELSAAYLGGTFLGVLARAGWVQEDRPGALAVADAMFRSAVTPWVPTHY